MYAHKIREVISLYHLRLQIHGQTHDILFSQQEIWQGLLHKNCYRRLSLMDHAFSTQQLWHAIQGKVGDTVLPPEV